MMSYGLFRSDLLVSQVESGISIIIEILKRRNHENIRNNIVLRSIKTPSIQTEHFKSIHVARSVARAHFIQSEIQSNLIKFYSSGSSDADTIDNVNGTEENEMGRTYERSV